MPFIRGLLLILLSTIIGASAGAAESFSSVANTLQKDWLTTVSDGDTSVDDFRLGSVDSAGNTYIALYATSPGNPPFVGAFIAKVDPNGTLVWKTPQSTDGFIDSPQGLGADAAGNVYLVSRSGTMSSLVKFDAAGNKLLTTRIGTKANAREPVDFHVLADGRTIQLIKRNSLDPLDQGFDLVCISTDGATVFSTKLPDSDYTQFARMDCDADGNAYVSYDKRDVPDVLSKFDATGALQWSVEFTEAPGVFVGTGVVVAATFDATTGNGLLLKLDPINGATVATYNHFERTGFAIGSFDGAGNVYAMCRESGGIAFVKFDASLNLQWIYRYSGPEYEEKPSGIFADNTGNVYCGISTFSGSTARNYVTVLLNSSGVPLAVDRERLAGLAVAAMGRDAAGTIRLAGDHGLPIPRSKEPDISTFAVFKYSGVTAPANGILQYRAPKSIKFGKLKSSDFGFASKIKKLNLKNKSKTDPVIVTFKSSGPPFYTDGSHMLMPGEKYTFEARFVPTAHGDFTGTLLIGSSDPAFQNAIVPLSASANPR
jgi:hypothetical protein